MTPGARQTARRAVAGMLRHVPKSIRRRSLRRVIAMCATRDLVVAKSTFEPYRRLTLSVIDDSSAPIPSWDYIRRGSAELLGRELDERSVEGAFAEVGVGDGDFAAVLNGLFPHRRLYLFDTFTGFAPEDQDADRSVGLPIEPYEMPAGSPERVEGRLPHPESVLLRVGRFPDTAVGLEQERFAFVHIDVGLHAPTYAAATWFYERLSPSGYLFVSDYNTSHTPGVKRAVRQFSDEVGATYVTLPDHSGAVVIAKPGLGSASPSS
jgi:O-methyltransferase